MDTSMSHELSNLRKFVAPEILFGAGARKAVANYARTFGARKVLLVSDPCSRRAALRRGKLRMWLTHLLQARDA
jgi:hypothetical protein